MLSIYSKNLENAVNEIAKLPGIGKRTALRLALHLLKTDAEEVSCLTDRINKLKTDIFFCKKCYNISDSEVCDICANPKRDPSIICVVQDIRDIIAIENTHQYQGVYHVLGGVISPMEGIGIQQLTLQELFDRVEQEPVSELILALPSTVEGDTTNFFIYKNVKDKVTKITTIARGIGVGEELEYADEVTLGRSLLSRTDFDVVYRKNG
ncbi:MAG: recombination protein RecR [Bacteroidales bacterium]|nr:recombination protein RecR [Bacteroidales bacterium]MBR6334034.1 recombination protein RecR [Bacteroidales bacterium]